MQPIKLNLLPNMTPAPSVQVKTALGDDFRRFQLEGTSISYLVLMKQVKQIYALPDAAPVLLKYKDEDGDLITLSSDMELKEAMRCTQGGTLRITVIHQLTPLSAAAPSAAAASNATPNSPPTAPHFAPAWRARREAWVAEKQQWHQQKIELKQQLHDVKQKLKTSHGEQTEKLQTMRNELKKLKEELKARKIENLHFPRDGIFLARFVKDVTIPDGTELQPGEPFVKTWRFRNETTRSWPAGSRLTFIGKNCDRLGAPDEVVVEREVLPQQEIDISMPMTAPKAPGRYSAYFRLAGPKGVKFGQRVWVTIVVAGDSSSEEKSDKTPMSKECEMEDMKNYSHQLQILSEMSFNDVKLNLRLLRKCKGKLDLVVEKLLKKRSKVEKRAP